MEYVYVVIQGGPFLTEPKIKGVYAKFETALAEVKNGFETVESHPLIKD